MKKQTNYSINLNELKKIQEKMAKSVILNDRVTLGDLKYIIGVDQSFLKDVVISGSVLLNFKNFKIIKYEISIDEVRFPYIPTFLMFREGDPAVKSVKKILSSMKSTKNTVIMVDGSGIAHPRKCGLATYIALKTNVATIGITKRKLYGEVSEPKSEFEATPILDNEKTIGYALKPCKLCKPIFISPGSFITVKTALEITKLCIKGHRLPEPIRFAHEIVTNYRKKFKDGKQITLEFE